MYVRVCVALLALSCFTAAADPDCDKLTKPLEDHSQVAGTWIFISGTSDNAHFRTELKGIISSWIKIQLEPDSDNFTLSYGDRLAGKCYIGSVNSTISGNSTKTTFNFNSTISEHVGHHLETCSDCVLWTDEQVRTYPNGEVKKGKNLYLFSKTGKVEESDLEVFKQQAACLGFPADFTYGSDKDLCPFEEAAAEEEQ